MGAEGTGKQDMAPNDKAGELKPAFPSSASIQATALWYVAPRECALNAEALPPLATGGCLVRTLWSGVSRGTERLVCEGRVPEANTAACAPPSRQAISPSP